MRVQRGYVQDWKIRFGHLDGNGMTGYSVLTQNDWRLLIVCPHHQKCVQDRWDTWLWFLTNWGRVEVHTVPLSGRRTITWFIGPLRNSNHRRMPGLELWTALGDLQPPKDRIPTAQNKVWTICDIRASISWYLLTAQHKQFVHHPTHSSQPLVIDIVMKLVQLRCLKTNAPLPD
jgi:hypothetical protein